MVLNALPVDWMIRFADLMHVSTEKICQSGEQIKPLAMNSRGMFDDKT
jgi:hypothetical protein